MVHGSYLTHSVEYWFVYSLCSECRSVDMFVAVAGERGSDYHADGSDFDV